MTPQAALEAQIERYRAMTGEERLKVALELHELACEVSRCGIRHQHPKASPKEVENLLQGRIALAERLWRILQGKIREGQTVHVDAKNGALEFREK